MKEKNGLDIAPAVYLFMKIEEYVSLYLIAFLLNCAIKFTCCHAFGSHAKDENAVVISNIHWSTPPRTVLLNFDGCGDVYGCELFFGLKGLFVRTWLTFAFVNLKVEKLSSSSYKIAYGERSNAEEAVLVCF